MHRLEPIILNKTSIFHLIIEESNSEGAGTWPNPFLTIFTHYSTFPLNCKGIYLTDPCFIFDVSFFGDFYKINKESKSTHLKLNLQSESYFLKVYTLLKSSF